MKTAFHTLEKKLNGKPPTFPVIAIGASADGLEAVKQLLHNLSTDTGMAFVIIQHLDPTHETFSLLFSVSKRLWML